MGWLLHAGATLPLIAAPANPDICDQAAGPGHHLGIAAAPFQMEIPRETLELSVHF